MKKRLICTLLVLLLLGLCAVGCGSAQEEPTVAPTPIASYTAEELKALLDDDPAAFDALVGRAITITGTLSRYDDGLLQGSFSLGEGSDNHIIFDSSKYDSADGYDDLRVGQPATFIAVVHGDIGGDIYLKYAFLVRG